VISDSYLSIVLLLAAIRSNDEAFPSIPKIMETFGRLFGGPRVLDLPIDKKGLTAWIERHSSEPLQVAHAWVEQYKMRHRKDRGD
jgi:hypothetical protein